MSDQSDQSEAMYPCPDCAAEQGDAGLNPASEFYWVKAPRYKDGVRRSPHCKRHTKARQLAARNKSEPGSGTREAKRRADRADAARNRDKQRVHSATYRKRHPEKVAERYRNWVERNRDKRKATQDAYQQRKRLRGVRPQRPKRYPQNES